MTISAGARFGNYEILGPLGAGGMSACGRGERPASAKGSGGSAGDSAKAEAKRVEPQRVGTFSRRNARMREAASVGGGGPNAMVGPRAHLRKEFSRCEKD